ncbi:methyltransferase domain-containing protein [Vallicoccus soli]|uniref:Methyltransferase domain-containing protein n=1 Tax=Vallicoccus soli TaxID=2339232 RepID=A0A3A3Z1C5_9ACTN|nr:methyltransferase domain-containing protein [Vallicoccus soli]
MPDCCPWRPGGSRSTVLEQRYGAGVHGLRALDIGCGFLAEEFARLGLRVTGVDPSAVSVATARRHAEASGLAIDDRVGAGESLPVEERGFDVVYCCDVLEHVDDLPRVVAETARVPARGGTYLFDTVDRTRTSRLPGGRGRAGVVLDAGVRGRPARLVDVHHAGRVARRLLREHGVEVREVVGPGPCCGALRLVADVVRARRGRTTYGELARRLDFGRTRSTAVSSMGWATPPRPGSAEGALVADLARQGRLLRYPWWAIRRRRPAVGADPGARCARPARRGRCARPGSARPGGGGRSGAGRRTGAAPP